MRLNAIISAILLFLCFTVDGQELPLVKYQDHLAKANESFNSGNYEQAAKSYSDALEIARSIFASDPEVLLECHISVGICNLELGKTDEALMNYQAAYQVLLDNELQENQYYEHVLLKLAEMYFSKSDYQDFLTIAKLRLKNLKNDPLEQTVEFAYRASDVADGYLYLGQYSASLPLYKNALAMFEKTVGLNTADYRNTLNNKCVALFNSDNYEMAAQCYEKTLEITDSIGESESEFRTDLMYEIIGAYGIAGQQKKSLKYFEDLISRTEREHGVASEIYLNRVEYLGDMWRLIGEHEKALALYEECKKIYEELEYQKTKSYASIINSIGLGYYGLGKYQEAEAFYLEAAMIYGELNLEDSFDFANIKGNLAVVYNIVGRVEEADKLYFESVELVKNKVGKQSRHYATQAMNYGSFLVEMGKLEEGLEYQKEALEIARAEYGEDNVQYADHLLNYAEALYLNVDYNGSLIHDQQAANIYKKHASKDDPRYAFALGGLALAYEALADFDKATQTFIDALDYVANSLGKDHLEYGKQAQLFARHLELMGNYKTALDYYDITMKIYEKEVGRDHHIYGMMCKGYADALIKNKDFELAQELIDRAISIIEETHGDTSVNYVGILMTQGALYSATEKYQKAVDTYHRIIDILIDHHNSSHHLIDNYFYLGLNYHYLKQYKEAQKNFLKYDQLFFDYVKNIYTFRNEQDKRKYNALFGWWVNHFNTFLFNPNYDNPDFIERSLNRNLSFKGLLLNASKDIITSLKKLQKPEVDKLISDFHNVRIVRTKQLSMTVKDRTFDLDSLGQVESKYETDLVKTYNRFFEKALDFDRDWTKVRDRLAHGDIAIEFIWYREAEDKLYTGKESYFAYLIKHNMDTPVRVSLFDSEELSELLKSKSINQIYRSRGSKAQSTVSGSDLYNLLWKPLEGYLEDVNRIYYSPAGQLNQIPFSALQNKAGETLVNKFDLIQLSSTGLLTSTRTNPDLNNSLFIGGVDYDKKGVKGNPGLENQQSFSQFTTVNQSDGTRRVGEKWDYLPGTLKEITDVTSLLKSNGRTYDLWIGSDATEEGFKSLNEKSQSVMHIATHGFFFENLKGSSGQSQAMSSKETYQFAQDPLLRSGLILAGANKSWASNESSKIGEDGILTAMEISNLDLSKTDLVVLSACETGLGDIDGSEGVYGLQRAFKMAGVDMIIMSLWQVPDKETAEFMTLFYENWLGGMDVRTAFNETQKTMQQRYREEPLKWAAFVLME